MSPLLVPVGVGEVAMVTLFEPRALESVVAPIPLIVCAALPELIVKSVGSSSHVPLMPFGARVVTFAPSLTVTRLPEVSMNPPFPPLGALASRVPATEV